MTVGFSNEEVMSDLDNGNFDGAEKKQNHTGLGFRENGKRARGSEYRQLFQLVLLKKREQRMEVVGWQGTWSRENDFLLRWEK